MGQGACGPRKLTPARVAVNADAASGAVGVPVRSTGPPARARRAVKTETASARGREGGSESGPRGGRDLVIHGPRSADARVERGGYGAAGSRALLSAPHTNRVRVRKTPSLAIGGSAHRPPSTRRTGSNSFTGSPSPSGRCRPSRLTPV